MQPFYPQRSTIRRIKLTQVTATHKGAARAAGMQVAAIPEEHTIDGLLAALAGWYGAVRA